MKKPTSIIVSPDSAVVEVTQEIESKCQITAVEVTPDIGTSKSERILNHIQERRATKCAPPTKLLVCACEAEPSNTSSPSTQTSRSDQDENEALLATTVSPFDVSLSIISGLTPHTPSNGYGIINLQSYQFTGRLDEQLDDPANDDPIWVSDYVGDMYASFRQREVDFLVNEDLLFEFEHWDWADRHELVDWLIGIHWGFQLPPEVLYLAINILDRYMEKIDSKKDFASDIVGLACLMIAAKHEDYPPKLKYLVAVCGGKFSGSEIMCMEMKILTALDFKVNAPTSLMFLLRFLKAAHYDHIIKERSFLILDATLPHRSTLRFLPSQLAAASIFLARESAGFNPWSPTLLQTSLYCEEVIAPVAEEIFLEQARKTPQAVLNKYRRCKDFVFERYEV